MSLGCHLIFVLFMLTFCSFNCSRIMFYVLVEPKMECICQEGFLMVNWAQIQNYSLAAIADRGLSHTPNFRNKWYQASCTVFLPAELTLIKAFLELSFNQWAETCPIQSELCNYYILICIYTKLLEWLHNN